MARNQGEVVNHERYAWQGSTLVHVRKLANGGNQQLTAERYIYEPGTHVPLAMHDTELGTLHFDVDHLGTPKELFDSEGRRFWQAEHSVYGQIESERSFKLHPVTGQQVAPKIRFQGQYEDSESGLFYNLNRYYDAEVGRYTTQDPIGLLGGLNTYQYCPNPVGWVDPLGLSSKEVCNAGLISRRKAVAFDFYKSQGFDEEDIPSHLSGIDFTKPVDVINVSKGTELFQFQSPGAPQGNYYTPRADTRPTELGISPLGTNRALNRVEPKVQSKYIVKDPTKILRSTAKPVDDFWSVKGERYSTEGGGTQYFSAQKNEFTLGD